MKVVYGVQGPADRVKEHSFPVPQNVLYCTYDSPVETSEISYLFLPRSTWATGRNSMLWTLQSNHPDADYFVLMDHDAHFIRGDFAAFEAGLARTSPALGFPVMSKAAQSATLLPELEVQRAIAVDEQFVAIHRSVVGEVGIAPLLSKYDWASWYVACFVFEYLCLIKYGSRCHQYNGIEISNNYHAWESDDETTYTRGNPEQYIQIVKDVLTSQFGFYDETVIEQLDRNAPDFRIASRRQSARIILDVDGMPIG